LFIILHLHQKKKKKPSGANMATASVPQPVIPQSTPAETSGTAAPATSTEPSLSKAERKAAKKARAKEKKEGVDEVDKALAELSVKCAPSVPSLFVLYPNRWPHAGIPTFIPPLPL
jgi:hypothetical protein